MAKANIRPNIDEGGVGFGIGIGPFGISYNSKDGGTFGVDAGLIGIEYNARGGGELEYFGGTFRFEYERKGCTLIEKGFIGGVHATTDIRKVPNCDDQGKEAEENSEQPNQEPDAPDDLGEDGGLISEEEIPLPPGGGVPKGISIVFSSDYYFPKITYSQGPKCDDVLEYSYTTRHSGRDFRYSSGSPPYRIVRRTYTVPRRIFYQGSGSGISYCVPEDHMITLCIFLQLDAETGQSVAGGFQCHFSYELLARERGKHFNGKVEVYVNGVPLPEYLEALPPNKPPITKSKEQTKMDECCKSIKRIENALGVERLIKDKFIFPNELMIPGSEGAEYAEDYMGIYSRMISVINQAGFSPFRVELPTPADFPEDEEKPALSYPSQQAALQAVMSLLIENKIEQRRQSILQLRLARMAGRMYLTIGKIWYRVTAILDGLGIPVRRKRMQETLEFNLLESKKKPQGFKEGSDRLPEFKETEDELIDDFLQNSEHEFSIDVFKENEKDIRRWLIYLLSKKG